MIFASRPVHVARILRKGGTASVRLPASSETAQARRYDLPLPSDADGLDQVLAACEARLDDPRDDLIEIDPPYERPGVFPDIWQRLATPQYPNSAISAGAGEVLLSCIVAESGRLRDCRIEMENPAARRLRASHTGRPAFLAPAPRTGCGAWSSRHQPPALPPGVEGPVHPDDRPSPEVTEQRYPGLRQALPFPLFRGMKPLASLLAARRTGRRLAGRRQSGSLPAGDGPPPDLWHPVHRDSGPADAPERPRP